MKDYSKITPIDWPISADRQSARRHYGVHPYFTRRPFNVVRDYILHYSREGDSVLDPFGGSGVTAIEAFLENRTGIHNDINPLANFIAGGIAGLERGNLFEYRRTLDTIREQAESQLGEIANAGEDQVERLQHELRLPDNADLPSNSDVSKYFELFSPRQLTSLAVLRKLIDALPDEPSKAGMLLAWSATLAKLNRTFLSTQGRAESRGGSSIFSIYRYKVAKNPIELDAWQTFEERAQNVIAAKAEIDKAIEWKRQTSGWTGKFVQFCEDVETVSEQLSGTIDYIFTDPPYGGHISYLDLSTLWNVWLGTTPTLNIREKELIVGGELDFGERHYVEGLSRSVSACVRMLKDNRWLSIVFQHWNTAYFEAILTAASDAGATLRAAVSQVGDPIWSMHKKKSSESVIAGELILTLYKTGQKQHVELDRPFDVHQALADLLSHHRAEYVYGEWLFNKLIVTAWNKSAIRSLSISKSDFTNLMESYGWLYDEINHYWVRDATQGLFSGTKHTESR